MNGCHICGSELVLVRGRNPGDDKRLVCPTCMADRMDTIRAIADPDYGRAYEAVDAKLKVEAVK